MPRCRIVIFNGLAILFDRYHHIRLCVLIEDAIEAGKLFLGKLLEIIPEIDFAPCNVDLHCNISLPYRIVREVPEKSGKRETCGGIPPPEPGPCGWDQIGQTPGFQNSCIFIIAIKNKKVKAAPHNFAFSNEKLCDAAHKQFRFRGQGFCGASRGSRRSPQWEGRQCVWAPIQY